MTVLSQTIEVNFYILAPLSIFVNVLSTNSRKELNLSGSYSFVGIVNDRPVYKVSFFHENFFIFSVCGDLFQLCTYWKSCYHRILKFLYSAKQKNL